MLFSYLRKSINLDFFATESLQRHLVPQWLKAHNHGIFTWYECVTKIVALLITVIFSVMIRITLAYQIAFFCVIFNTRFLIDAEIKYKTQKKASVNCHKKEHLNSLWATCSANIYTSASYKKCHGVNIYSHKTTKWSRLNFKLMKMIPLIIHSTAHFIRCLFLECWNKNLSQIWVTFNVTYLSVASFTSTK